MLYLVAQSCPTLYDLPARLLCSWGFSGQEYWSGLPCPLHRIMLKTWQPPEGAERGWSSSKPMSLFDLSSGWFPGRSLLQGWLHLTSSRGWPLGRPFPRGICQEQSEAKITGDLRWWMTGWTVGWKESLGDEKPTGGFEKLQGIAGHLEDSMHTYGCASDQGCMQAQGGVSRACTLCCGSAWGSMPTVSKGQGEFWTAFPLSECWKRAPNMYTEPFNKDWWTSWL